jgi:hypothetical protein
MGSILLTCSHRGSPRANADLLGDAANVLVSWTGGRNRACCAVLCACAWVREIEAERAASVAEASTAWLATATRRLLDCPRIMIDWLSRPR